MFGENWYATYLWTDFGLKFIDEARKANKPFFLYLPYNAPHFPLMAPADLIAKHRGKYKAGWDRLRDARYRRQIKMGLIDARWPLSAREAESPAWESLSDEAKDRFDHLMAVYAAMVEAIDMSVGTLVKGLEARGALDNTMILFLSDNGANAESGPDGRFDGESPGGPNSNLYLGMNWATLSSTPFRRFKHFTHEGGIAAPLIVHWPRGIAASRRNALVHQPAHLIDVMPTVLDVTGVAYPRSTRARPSSRWRASACARRLRAAPWLGRNRSSGSTKATARCDRETGSSCRPIRTSGSSTTWPRIVSSATISPPAVPISSRRSRRNGTPGPSEPTWIPGSARAGCRGATTRDPGRQQPGRHR